MEPNPEKMDKKLFSQGAYLFLAIAGSSPSQGFKQKSVFAVNLTELMPMAGRET